MSLLRCIQMREYRFFNDSEFPTEVVISMIDDLSKEGWRVVCPYRGGLLLTKNVDEETQDNYSRM